MTGGAAASPYGGGQLPSVAQSTYCIKPECRPRDGQFVAKIRAITNVFEGYGYRCMDTDLHNDGYRVNTRAPIQTTNGLCQVKRAHSTLLQCSL